MSTSIYRYHRVAGCLTYEGEKRLGICVSIDEQGPPRSVHTHLQLLHRNPALDLPRPARGNAQRNYPAIYAESWSAEKVDEVLGMPEFDFSRGDVGEEDVEIEGDCPAT